MSATRDNPEQKNRELLSRRRFLSILTGVCSGMLGCGGLRLLDVFRMQPLATVCRQRTLAEMATYEKDIVYIQEKYGIDIHTNLSSIAAIFISGREPQEAELAWSLPLIRQALAVYPPELFREQGVSNLTLLLQACLFGKRIGGAAFVGAIYLSVDKKELDQLYAAFLAANLHHELFHELFMIGGDLTSFLANRTSFPQQADLWKQIYCASCDPYQDNFPDSYFYDQHSQTCVEEDMAQVAGFMLSPAHHRYLLSFINKLTDPKAAAIWRAKMAFIKKCYLSLSHGQMDERFWQDLVTNHIDEKYWPQRRLAGVR